MIIQDLPLPTLKIFISSPGDVMEERKVAKDVLNRLQREFAVRVRLEPVQFLSTMYPNSRIG
jgi:uncharacterized protein YlxP (DUF503 family)